MISRPIPIVISCLLLLACAPKAPGTPTLPPQNYVVRVSSGDLEGVAVDWAILPDEGWPVDGRRDRTPFSTDLPSGQVAALFRVKGHTPVLEITVLRQLPDGTLQRVAQARRTAFGVVVLDPATGNPEILTTPGPDGLAHR